MFLRIKSIKKEGIDDIMMIEKIQQPGNEIQLFSKHTYYFVNQQWVRYIEKLVNGRLKKTNQVMCRKELSDLYQEIQSVWDKNGQLVVSRKTKADTFKFSVPPEEVTATNEKSQFIRPISLAVKKLTPNEKVSLQAMLARDNVTYCEFEDIKGLTRIKTSAKGYRLLSLIV